MKIDISRIGNVISKSVPHLLTGVGILWFAIGTKAAFDAGVSVTKMVSQKDDFEETVPVTAKDIAKEVLPAVGAFAVGASCVIMSDISSTMRVKATEAAYNRLAANAAEYRAAIIGALGAEADKIARKASVDGHAPEKDEPELPAGYFHFYDSFSRNTFVGKMEDVIAAEYDANRYLNEYGFLSVNRFYDFLGLVSIDRGDDIGWDIGELADYCGICWLDFENVEHIEEDGTKWYSIHYSYEPTMDGIIDWDAIRNDYHLRCVELFEAKAGGTA